MEPRDNTKVSKINFDLLEKSYTNLGKNEKSAYKHY
jgi:hypothetical protein